MMNSTSVAITWVFGMSISIVCLGIWELFNVQDGLSRGDWPNNGVRKGQIWEIQQICSVLSVVGMTLIGSGLGLMDTSNAIPVGSDGHEESNSSLDR